MISEDEIGFCCFHARSLTIDNASDLLVVREKFVLKSDGSPPHSTEALSGGFVAPALGGSENITRSSDARGRHSSTVYCDYC